MTWLRDNNTHLNEKQTVASPIEPIVSWISVGDYIIKGVKGEFYPCKPDIFHLTYDAC